ncbi:MAG: tyrosine-type recombinase/integrase [Rhodoglobus sp.]
MTQRRAFGTIRRLPSKRYQASYIGPDGRRHVGWSTCLVKADAEVWLRDEELLIDRGQWTSPARRSPIDIASPMTLAEYAAATLRRRATRARRPIRPTTVDLYAKLLDLAILPTLGRLPLVDITPAIIARWYESLPPNPTQNGNAYQLLRSIMNDALEDELIDRNPVKIKGAGKPQPKRRGQALNIGELTAYTAVATDHALPLLLAAWCALRSGEVRALRACDIAPDATALQVAQTVTKVGRGGPRSWRFGPPKTDAGARRVAVPPHLRPMLRDALDAHTGADALLFPSPSGQPMDGNVLREAHKRAAGAIGRPSMTLHDLRRTGATLAGQSGATTKELMRMLGHTQPAVAMLYQVADDKRDDERAARMSALLPRGEE